MLQTIYILSRSLYLSLPIRSASSFFIFSLSLSLLFSLSSFLFLGANCILYLPGSVAIPTITEYSRRSRTERRLTDQPCYIIRTGMNIYGLDVYKYAYGCSAYLNAKYTSFSLPRPTGNAIDDQRIYTNRRDREINCQRGQLSECLYRIDMSRTIMGRNYLKTYERLVAIR